MVSHTSDTRLMVLGIRHGVTPRRPGHNSRKALGRLGEIVACLAGHTQVNAHYTNISRTRYNFNCMTLRSVTKPTHQTIQRVLISKLHKRVVD